MAAFTTAAIIGAAAVGAGATVYASNKASGAAKNAAAANSATIANPQSQNNALLQPYVQGGVKAQDAIQAFLGLNGSASQDEAFSKWRDSTGYKFTLGQGLDAVSSNRATAGLLKSGSTLKALSNYGQNTANAFGQQYLGNLQAQQASGLQAAGANVSANSNAASMSVGNQNALAGSLASNAMTTGNAINNLSSNIIGAYGLGNAASGKSTGSSYGGPSGDGSASGGWEPNKWTPPPRNGNWI
jgi:hypothetical protein